MSVALNTARGSMTINQEHHSAKCAGAGCKTMGGGMARLSAVTVGHPDVTFHLCGDCIAAGLAVALGSGMARDALEARQP